MYLFLFSGRYPPYSESKLNFLATLLRKRKGIPTKYLSHLFVFGVGVAVTVLVNCMLKVKMNK